MEQTGWENRYNRHGGEIQEKAEWIWILGYENGSCTNSTSSESLYAIFSSYLSAYLPIGHNTPYDI